VKLGSLCGEEIQARKNWAHMFWAVFQWKLLQSDEAKEASMKGEVNNWRSRQSSEQGSQGRPVCPFFLPVASSQCSACLHYCEAHPLLHHCCFLHPQQTSTFLQYIQTQNAAQFFFIPKCILSYLKRVGQCSGSGVPFSSIC
jgi:hypothetical protein